MRVATQSRAVLASLALLGLAGCSSSRETPPGAIENQGAAGAGGAGGLAGGSGGGRNDTGSWSTNGPPTDAPATDEPFRFEAPQGNVAPWTGEAQIEIREAHTQEGFSYPEYATILAGGQGGADPSAYGISFMFSVTGEELLATHDFLVPANLPGGGGAPEGAAAATIAFPAGAPRQVLTNGQLQLHREAGQLSGTVSTNTSAGVISFSGLYTVYCFAVASRAPAPAGAIGVDPDSLVHDPDFESAFCKRFAGLRASASGLLGCPPAERRRQAARCRRQAGARARVRAGRGARSRPRRARSTGRRASA